MKDKMKSRQRSLRYALERLFDELDQDILEKIVNLLNYYLQNDSISYKIIEKLSKDNPTDTLLFLWENKLLIPQHSTHGTLEWGDALLDPSLDETFRIPQISKQLLQEVQKTGIWNIEEAIRKKFKQIGDPNYQKMPRLIKRLYSVSQNQTINGSQIRQICENMNIANRIDSIISELKGIGIMSPTISNSLLSSVKSKSPLYKLNSFLLKLYGA